MSSERLGLEETMSQLLDRLRPEDVLESRVLTQSFTKFFQKGDCKTVRDLVSTWTKKRKKRTKTSGDDLISQATSRFPQRQSLLRQGLLTFATPEGCKPDFYTTLWSAGDNVFEKGSNDAWSRLCRLLHGATVVDREANRYDTIRRFVLLFIQHEVDVYKQHVDVPGEKAVTSAVKLISRETGLSADYINDLRMRGRGYSALVDAMGPGILAEIRKDTSGLWEKKLSSDDVRKILDIRRDNFPQLDKRARNLNPEAGKAMLEGLKHYGWNSGDLRQCGSRLLCSLRKHCGELLERLCTETDLSSGQGHSTVPQFNTNNAMDALAQAASDVEAGATSSHSEVRTTIEGLRSARPVWGAQTPIDEVYSPRRDHDQAQTFRQELLTADTPHHAQSLGGPLDQNLISVDAQQLIVEPSYYGQWYGFDFSTRTGLY